MFTLIEHGEVFAPDPRGAQSVLLAGDRIARIGPVDRRALDALDVPLTYIDAAGCVVTPGFIDPHAHLLGGSGEKGFASQSPELSVGEIAGAGITTVVGCLGVDTTMKTLPGLLARVKALRELGLGAWMWTGGYNVPPTTMLTSVREDIMFVAEVIGAGEIAISDGRATDPDPHELARLVTDAHVGGMLSRKAGVTHFHVGPGPKRLAVLRAAIERDDLDPSWLYVTHVNRSDELLCEAIELVRRGATADIDAVEGDVPRWVRSWLDEGGDPDRLTLSSDASLTSPAHFTRQARSLHTAYGMPLDRVLRFVTTNTARVLALGDAGELAPGKAADVLVLERGSLEVVHALARGRPTVRDGAPAVRERFLEDSNRRIRLDGDRPEAD